MESSESDNDNNSNNSNNNLSDDDNEAFQHFFDGLDETSLRIISRTTDDLFTGTASKQVFYREPGQDHLRFDFYSEIYIYVNFLVRPFVEATLSGNQSYYIWLAVLLEFSQINNPSDIAKRWCSFRNQNWYLSFLDTPAERESFISDIFSVFIDDTVADITDMSSEGSGWRYNRVLRFDVRHVVSSPQNRLRFGRRKKPEDFNPHLNTFFKGRIFDSNRYIHETTGYQVNLCVPASILLSLYLRLHPNGVTGLTKKDFTNNLNSFHLKQFSIVGDTGISLKDTNKFERFHSPIPISLLNLFPALAFFDGFAINFFRIKRSQQNLFNIFPFALSPNTRKTSFFQVDLLVDTSDIRTPSSNLHRNKAHFHVLVIKDLKRLLYRYSSFYSNLNKYRHICRTCFKVFFTRDLFAKHELSCTHLERKMGIVNRRKSRNVLIHSPYVFNNFTKKKEINGLSFRRGQLFTFLRPLTLGFLDFESFNRVPTPESFSNPSNFEAVPSTAVFHQSPMSYCYSMRSLYTDFPLPPYLSDVRIKFLNEDTASLKDFFIDLLLSLRIDLERQVHFLNKVTALDPGAPRLCDLSLKDRIHFMSARFCSLCGKTFGSFYLHPRTNKKVVTRKNKDHNHFLR